MSAFPWSSITVERRLQTGKDGFRGHFPIVTITFHDGRTVTKNARYRGGKVDFVWSGVSYVCNKDGSGIHPRT